LRIETGCPLRWFVVWWVLCSCGGFGRSGLVGGGLSRVFGIFITSGPSMDSASNSCP